MFRVPIAAFVERCEVGSYVRIEAWEECFAIAVEAGIGRVKWESSGRDPI